MPILKKSVLAPKIGPHDSEQHHVIGAPAQSSQLSAPMTSTTGSGNSWYNLSGADIEKMAKGADSSNAPAQPWWTMFTNLFRGKAKT